MKRVLPEPPRRPRASLFDQARDHGLSERIIGKLDTRLANDARRKRRRIRSAAVAVVLGAMVAWGIPFFKSTASIAVPAAQRQSVTLADGSVAELNAGTEIKTDFRYGRRQVILTMGEGFFSVTPGAADPFRVETPAGEVIVLGTQFNVRVDSSGSTEVTLVDGRVLLKEGDSPSASLAPNQQATLGTAGAGVHTLSSRDLERVLAWRRGQIVLDGLSLAEACRRFAEFHRCALTVDASVPPLHLGGTYSLGDLTQFIEALRETQAVRVVSNADGSYRILGR